MLGSERSPARNSARSLRSSPRSPARMKNDEDGSSLRMARKAVGAVNMVVTRYSEAMRQKVLASGVPTGLPSRRMVVAPARSGA